MGTDKCKTDKLKPCPFCGNKRVYLTVHDKKGHWQPKIICHWDNNNYDYYDYEGCEISFQHGLYGGGIDIDVVEDSIIKAWNTRKP